MPTKLLVSLLLMLAWTAAALALTPQKREADTLRDLPGVFFVVEELSQDVQSDGLTTEQLRRDVELQLRESATHLMTEEEWERTPGKAFLYVRVSTLRSGPGYAFHLEIQLFQRVRLERYQQLAPVQVPTWAAQEEIGVIEAGRVQEIRRYVLEQLKEFTQAYMSVNTV